ncbi:MAG TPA: hypothetical protein VG297_07465 [Bryobacteraceae bacterium]|jgi:hypothetical protein|nr:hypothetical protein [Bryobacteraceae bacterium]
MFELGIRTEEQYMKMGPRRRFSGPRVAYNLLRVGENPTEEQIKVFEDISVTLQAANGTYRTSYPNRFEDVDAAFLKALQELFPAGAPLRIEDRAVSHGLTSYELAEKLFPIFPAATIEASDLLLELLELTTPEGDIFITEIDGTPLQYIRPPFVVGIHHPESWKNPFLRLVAAQARKRFRRLALPPDWMGRPDGEGFWVRRIPYIHPKAAMLARSDSRLRFCRRSVFERSVTPCDVVRTMNIFNRGYFSDDRLREGFSAIFASLSPGGVWIAGRSLLEDLTNHASVFRRGENGWKVMARVGSGWELEEMVCEASR